MDWGSARPFSIGWWAVVQDDTPHDGALLPRNAIVRYREWYGAKGPNEGLKIPAEIVAAGIRQRELGEDIAYGVLDPAAFAVISGPSIGETFNRKGRLLPPCRQRPQVRGQTLRRLGSAARPPQRQ